MTDCVECCSDHDCVSRGCGCGLFLFVVVFVLFAMLA